jgi:hypothetical protein
LRNKCLSDFNINKTQNSWFWGSKINVLLDFTLWLSLYWRLSLTQPNDMFSPFTLKNTFCKIATTKQSLAYFISSFHIKTVDFPSHRRYVVCIDWEGQGWVPLSWNKNTSQWSNQISSGFHLPCLSASGNLKLYLI